MSALAQEAGPLPGLHVTFRHVRYDWCRPDDLRPPLNEARTTRALIVCSSEGGLFEYGSDDEIQSNLRVLREPLEVVAVVGSVTRADEPIQRLRQMGRAATHPRGLEVFRSLIVEMGWKVARAIQPPFSDQVVLT